MRELPNPATDHWGMLQIKHSADTVSSMDESYPLSGYNKGRAQQQIRASFVLTNLSIRP